MPRTETEAKTKLVCTRLTPIIGSVVFQQAAQEGLTSSEWIRNIIIKELRERQVLPKIIFRLPESKE